MMMLYRYKGRVCHVAQQWHKGLVTIRFGTPRDWKGEKIVLFEELT